MGTLVRNAAVALACAASAGCQKTGTPPPAPLASARAALVRRFTPPADGLLTDPQLDRFVAVRRAARGRTEADAARALGLDPDEYAWVRARVVEATVALDERRVRAAAAETTARALAQLHQTRAALHDTAAVRTLDEQIAALERERAAWKKPDPPPPSVAANAKRIERRRSEIDAAPP